MTTCPSCGIAGNNFSCPNHMTFWGINPLPDSIPTPPQSPTNLTPFIDEEKEWLFAETGRLHLSLTKANKEIERLKSLMPPDERGPGFVSQGSWSVFAEKVLAERDAALERVTELTECLRWYVQNDETQEGGTWEESNGFWLRGKRRAMRALGMED